MKEVLLPFDFSPHAKRALSLAMRGFPFGAETRVTLLHIIDDRLYHRVLPSASVPANDAIAGFLGAEIEKARSDAKGPGVRVEVARGFVVPEIASRLRNAQYDALIIGGQGHGGFAETLLGTTAHRLIRQTTVPALIVKRANAVDLPKTAICAVDLEMRVVAGLQMANTLARDFGVVIDTISVLPEQRWPYSQYVASELRVDSELRASEAKRLTAFEVETINRLVSVARHVDCGPPAASIVRYGESRDLIVLGGDRQAHVGRSVLGTTIEQVLGRANADVLIAR